MAGTTRFAALAAILLGGGLEAAANVLPAAGNRQAPAHELGGIELKVLQNEQRMLQYQRDHQRFMEDLRRVAPAEQVRPVIPRMQPNCKLRVHGSTWLDNCR